MNVLVTGASGFVGKKLLPRLAEAGHKTAVVSRSPGKDYDWSPESLAKGVAWADAVIHLAGENIAGKRWSSAQKEKIKKSRTESTQKIAEAVAKRKPQCFISASAVGFYPTSETEVFTENSKNGEGFLADVCREWENAAAPARDAGVRTVTVRIGVVLGIGGGALQKMLLPFKLFLGGPLGNGRQWVPWVHIDDLVALFVRLLDDKNASGVYNGTSPNPVTMGELAKTLGRVLGRPSFMPAPAFALKIALGEMSDMLLEGQRVAPERTLAEGFQFRYPLLEPALRNLLGK